LSDGKKTQDLLQVFFNYCKSIWKNRNVLYTFIFKLDTELKVRSCSILNNIRVRVCACACVCVCVCVRARAHTCSFAKQSTWNDINALVGANFLKSFLQNHAMIEHHLTMIIRGLSARINYLRAPLFISEFFEKLQFARININIF